VALNGVFEDDGRGLAVAVDGQVTSVVQDDGVTVSAVERGQVLPPLRPGRVYRDGDQELGDDVLGEDVEEVLAVDQAAQPFQDDLKERLKGLELLAVFGVISFSSLLGGC
jgi:hypothetical protein